MIVLHALTVLEATKYVDGKAITPYKTIANISQSNF